MLNGPARFLPGNHDLDFDSPEREHNFDTFRAHLGPDYYSYDSGKAHVIALNSIEYPTKQPAKKSDYTYGLGEKQLEWLRNDLAQVPDNQLIVLASHSPLLEFLRPLRSPTARSSSRRSTRSSRAARWWP